MTDLLLTNARILDGSGAPWFRGAISVADGRIERLHRRPEPETEADEVLDAENAVVSPGFIDTHSHSDLQLFSDPTLAPKVRQGITTEILGQDGFSMAPLYDGDPAVWRRQLSALAGGFEESWDWEGVDEYLDTVVDHGVAPHVATLVGHGTVRFDVLGMSDRDPTSGELDEMCSRVETALEEGAIGLSTGLIYTPCTYASTAEVRALAEAVSPTGRPFVAHIRSEGRWIWEALDEFVDIGAETGVPLHLSHFKTAGEAQYGTAERAIHLVDAARERGVDFTAEAYPYTAGSTMLSALLPPWLHADGPDEMLDQLTDETVRTRIRRDVEEWRIAGWENFGGLAGWENVFVTSVSSESNADAEGRSIRDVADRRGVGTIEAVCDLLVEEELGVSIRVHTLAEADVETILETPWVCIGSDGLFGGRPHPRVYGTFPRVLGEYTRRRNLLSLPEAVQKSTSLPARIFGLDSKGLLRPGLDADLVVFDPRTVSSPATFDDPTRYPTGIQHVLVDGEFVVRDGETTGATPGRALRA
ncbi:N-acyl-D-amino acid deacylase [Haloprofundus marisrubri]|uniref:N-acyl-D-amino acid deacylase n=1 Tax=Haloprofundus marisrubri TaxID=1514971 RepID=A0A0W1R2Y6_9EURY|nr:D-aminoacylase [Haloprofundus marisrubri]KTG07704.1 N-acyl-D-amino acid deacylase [Haloprofundus marisrubri]